jgi:exodeoxyribonuclease V alpha subunit
MLQRRLLYTAITRAEHAIVMVGQHRALQMAVEQTGARRNTALTRRLNDRLIYIP